MPDMMERTLFLKSLLSNPLETGAVAPSSSSLARLMTRAIDPTKGCVVELGPGTGVFTKHILDTGLPAHKLLLIEKHPEFVDHLRRQYPGVEVDQMDVTQMRKQQERLHALQAQAVISGLPLLAMGLKAQMSILKSSFEAMHPEASFYQFTYYWRCPIATAVLDRLGLVSEPLGRVWLNLPPASVFRIRRVTSDYAQA